MSGEGVKTESPSILDVKSSFGLHFSYLVEGSVQSKRSVNGVKTGSPSILDVKSSFGFN